MSREQLPGSTETLILRLLQDKDMYGYEMVTELARRSNNEFTLKEGTLYPLLHLLEKQKAVESYDERVDNRTRRYYHLTEEGRARLEEKKEEWARYASAVSAILCS